MQKFGYRNPRYPVDFPVRLTIRDSSQTVRCRNISLDGMRLQIRAGLALYTRGEVSFDYDDLSFALRVRVAHSGSASGGVKFMYESEDQKSAVLELIARLAARQSSPGLLAVPISKQIIVARRRLFS